MTVGLRIVSLLPGLLALFGENLFSPAVWEGVLAAFMASIVVLWGITIGQKTGVSWSTAGKVRRLAQHGSDAA